MDCEELKCDCDDFEKIHTGYYSPRCPHSSIIRLCNVLEEKISENMISRHVNHLKEAIRDNQAGFHVCDLGYVTRIIERISMRLHDVEEYLVPFRKFLEICAKPPITYNANEEIDGFNDLIAYVSILGLLNLWLYDPDIHAIVYNAIYQLLFYKKKTVWNSIGVKTLQKAIEESHLPEIAVQLIETCPYSEYKIVLDICLLLSSISHNVCRRMVLLEAIDHMSLRVVDLEKSDIHLIYCYPISDLNMWFDNIATIDQTFIIFWNFYHAIKDASREYLASVKGPSRNALWALRVAVRVDVMKKNRDKQRNNKTAFVLALCTVLPNMELISSGIAIAISYMAISTELPTPKTLWLASIDFKMDNLFVEFKKLLLSYFLFYHHYSSMKGIIIDLKVILALCKLISMENADLWPQEEEAISLAKLALHIMYQFIIVPEFIDLFVEFNGPLRLLIHIETFLIGGSEKFDVEVLRTVLKVLNRGSSTESENIIKNIKENSGQNIVIKLANKYLSQEKITLSDQEHLSYCFSILMNIFEEEKHKDVICLLIQHFRRVVKPQKLDSVTNPYTVISALDYLWKIVANCKEGLSCFIKNGGIYLLLDLIEISCFPIQTIGLGCLVDICENVAAVPFFLTWRGGPKKNLVFHGLLASIFMYENKEIQARVTEKSVIISPKVPLMGENQYNLTFSDPNSLSSSPAVVDLLGSCRPKIYALLQLLNTRHGHIASEINRLYKIATVRIPVTQKVVLVMAEHYLLLKIAEAWQELKEDVHKSHLRLVHIDQRMIDTITVKLEELATEVIACQEQVLHRNDDKEKHLEHKLYNALRESRFQEAFDAFRDIHFIVQSTNKAFMEVNKNRQSKEIEQMVKICANNNANTFHHETFYTKVPTTAVFKQQLAVYQTNYCLNCCDCKGK